MDFFPWTKGQYFSYIGWLEKKKKNTSIDRRLLCMALTQQIYKNLMFYCNSQSQLYLIHPGLFNLGWKQSKLAQFKVSTLRQHIYLITQWLRPPLKKIYLIALKKCLHVKKYLYVYLQMIQMGTMPDVVLCKGWCFCKFTYTESFHFPV